MRNARECSEKVPWKNIQKSRRRVPMSGMGGKRPSVAISVDLLQNQYVCNSFSLENLRRTNNRKMDSNNLCRQKVYKIIEI
jgi:hypothetical protein